MRKFTTTLGALLVMAASSTLADGHKVKVGMITTLSGGGSGLGIDVRDGFMLAVKDNKKSMTRSMVFTSDRRDIFLIPGALNLGAKTYTVLRVYPLSNCHLVIEFLFGFGSHLKRHHRILARS